MNEIERDFELAALKLAWQRFQDYEMEMRGRPDLTTSTLSTYLVHPRRFLSWWSGKFGNPPGVRPGS